MTGPEVHPATVDRFDDVRAVLAPADPTTPACWCLSMRLPNAEFRGLRGEDRPARLARYAAEGPAPGVVGYLDGVAAGWCSVAPRPTHHRLLHSRTIPLVPPEDDSVWSVVCLVVRPGYRRRGLAAAMLGGAVDHARRNGAGSIEGYPVALEPGRRISSTFAHVGTTALFERAGFARVADTDAHSGGASRVVMRLPL